MHRFFVILASALLVGAIAFAQAPANTYVFSTFGAPASLDPVRAYDTASGAILENVYETLFTFDDPAIDSLKPLLATDVQVLNDGLTYRFTLRDGVQFHSGNTMTCADVAWSIKYGLVTAAPEGATSYLLGKQFLGSQQTGDDLDAFLAAVSWDAIDGAVTCPDGPGGLVADLNLQAPDPAFMAVLAYTAFGVIDSQYAIANGVWDGTEATWQEWIGRDLTEEFLHRNPSGTGAYRVVEWGDASLIATRFDGYWGGAPQIENVVFNYVDEEATRILALQQGDADRIVLGQRASLVQVRGAPGVTVHEEPDWAGTCVSAGMFNFAIDTTDNVDVGSGQLDGNGIPADFFTDVNLRRGFAHLFDQEEFIAQVYQGAGTTLTMGLPNTFPGYNPDVPVRTLDLEAAEQAFRLAWDGAVWETGFEFTALYNAGNTTRETLLNIIKDNVEFINPKFKMSVRSIPWPDFLARTSEKKVPFFALGWCADYADARNFVNTYYDNDGFFAARTSIDIPAMQAIIDEADVILDQETRAFLYRDIGTLHYDQAPLIVYPVPTEYILARDNISGIYFNPMRSHYFLWKDIAKN
ncbi:MAG: ABC transporter substrate-binding protein [Trueperaceae bacterium]|nr:ABC transporter substrate-binding protein [Trueperaceae bacterium]